MEEAGHSQVHGAQRTGFRWFDVCLAVSALVVSLSSLWLTLHNARTMERLVASNSYPNVDVVYGNTLDLRDGAGLRPVLWDGLENTGIGPARLRSIEVSFDGKPVTGLHGLLALCCTGEAQGSPPRIDYHTPGDLRGAMLPAGRSVQLFTWPAAPADPRWERLAAARLHIAVRVCYCSLFEECYLRESARREPERIKTCPVPGVPFVGD